MSHLGDVPGTGEGGDLRELIAPESGRVDAVIASAFQDLSRARVQRLIDAGKVLVDGAPVRKSEQVEAGARISIVVPPAVAPASPRLNLPVLYEDESVVAIDKPAGLAVHGAVGDTAPSVVGWFLARYPEAARTFYSERPGLVHRLDKDTSGVMLLAKTPEAQEKLSRAFAARETVKTYLAICDGVPRNERAVIEAPVGRHPGDRTRMAIASDGREARTTYVVLATDNDRSLLEVHPETGRTHQIRVHLRAIGVPVRYDRVYGKEGPGRQMLHAWRLRVPHPDGGTLTVTAPIPADFRAELRAMNAEEAAMPYTVHCPPQRET